jgi:Mg2+ and Co2+ transporter CorA
MNVDLPHFGLSGITMFWVLMGLMAGIVAVMLVYFRRRGWI